jgi:hypothetical protein
MGSPGAFEERIIASRPSKEKAAVLGSPQKGRRSADSHPVIHPLRRLTARGGHEILVAVAAMRRDGLERGGAKVVKREKEDPSPPLFLSPKGPPILPFATAKYLKKGVLFGYLSEAWLRVAPPSF